MNQTVRVRFAPSPTGNPHVGNFRTALFNYLFAKHHGGQFLIRIEDTDKERSLKEYEEAIFESLAWLGLDLDGEPVRQSERVERHKAEALRLLEEGKAYRCRCTPERIDALREEQRAQGKNPMYDGHCREANHPDDGTPFCVRLKTPQDGVVTVADAIRGDVVIQNEELDDLIILRTDGTPTYNFAVVVDDRDMEITHVLRGDDHLRNTARQVGIYDLLGYDLPSFAHLPQILGKDKKRLSKRHGATGVLEYRDEGYIPEGFINFLARLGWGHGDQEVFTKEELCEHFTLEAVNKSPAVFDREKLFWLNGEHIRRLDNEELGRRFAEHATNKGIVEAGRFDSEEGMGLLATIVKAAKERSRTLDEMIEMVGFVFQDEIEFEEGNVKKMWKPEALPAMEELADYAKANIGNTLAHEDWETKFGELMEKHGIKMKLLGPSVRLALTGTKASPPIFQVFDLLGCERTEQRLRRAINCLAG